MNMTFDEAIKNYALPFEKDEDLTAIIDAIGNAKIVLLGEASHGTSEFYTVRAELSKRLIEEKGFTIIAVEGDWPSSQHINRYIKNYDKKQLDPRDVLKSFGRWPTWMWANEEIVDFMGWLKSHNDKKSSDERVGFYGIDIYSLWESIDEILHYLKHTNPSGGDFELAKKAFSCFEPFNQMPEHYALSTAHFTQKCIDEVTKLLSSIRSNNELYSDKNEQDLNLKLNAMVAKNAEEYYRAMFQSDATSWNIRDQHMVEAINEVRNYYGNDAKIIIWEHNTHIGDARATTMKDEGMLNVGQLLREQNKNGDVYAVGFSTHRGTVIAAEAWGVPFEELRVPPARKNSWEDALHQAGAFNKILVFNEENRSHFTGWIGHRAIGVVYNPEYEALGNYVPTRIGYRYDAFIYIDQTEALHPLFK